MQMAITRIAIKTMMLKKKRCNMSYEEEVDNLFVVSFLMVLLMVSLRWKGSNGC
jgi:hypothetical protein